MSQYGPPQPQYNPQQYNPAPPVNTILGKIAIPVIILVVLGLFYIFMSSKAATPPSVSATGMIQPGGTGTSSAGSGTGITSSTPVVSPELIKFSPPVDNSNINMGSAAPSVDGASTNVVVSAPKNIVLAPPPPPPAVVVMQPPVQPTITPPVQPTVVVIPPPPPPIVQPTSAAVVPITTVSTIPKVARLYAGLNFVSNTPTGMGIAVMPGSIQTLIAKHENGSYNFAMKSMKVDQGVKIMFTRQDVDPAAPFQFAKRSSFAVGQYNVPDMEKWLRTYDRISGAGNLGHGSLGLDTPPKPGFQSRIYVQTVSDAVWVARIQEESMACVNAAASLKNLNPSQIAEIDRNANCTVLRPATFESIYTTA